MFIPLYQLARIRYEDRQAEADRRRAAEEIRAETKTGGFDKLQSVAMFIGLALLPLGESLRSPVSEPRNLDISAP